jgi:hypothetical protein
MTTMTNSSSDPRVYLILLSLTRPPNRKGHTSLEVDILSILQHTLLDESIHPSRGAEAPPLAGHPT